MSVDNKQGMVPTYELINRIIKRQNYDSYLEIGIDVGDTFNRVIVKHKVGVDPHDGADPISKVANEFVHRKSFIINGISMTMTSDEFFRMNEETFDLIYIDGLHTALQSARDIRNSLKVLRPGGIILVDDVSPKFWNEAQERPMVHGKWRGTVYQTFCEYRTTRGVGATGAIRGGQGYIIPSLEDTPYDGSWQGPWISFEEFIAIREKILPKQSVDFFLEKIVGQLEPR